MDAIENKIANSGLETLDLGDFYDNTPRTILDIRPWLFQEMIIKENEFKEHLKLHNWEQYEKQYVCFYSSVDAIIPNWAWLMIANHLQGNCKRYFNGTPEQLNEILFSEAISKFDSTSLIGKRVLIKGCGDKEIPSSAFSMMASKLLPIVKSLMFGEACSNVPIYKQKLN
ncbi:MAG: DUF2480 family protein [Flavobacteriales bacterium]|nr:DUF2480 family protein [Flavobacteriales bacterium]